MKIKQLSITNYKNLDAKMHHESDIIAFIGNNGSGKSNLLEALSSIFKSLYSQKELDVSFDYYLEYTNTDNNLIKINKNKSVFNFTVNDVTQISYIEFLPKRTIAIYSGEEQRLWKKCFEPFYLDYVKKINKSNTRQLGEISQLPKMLYLNRYYWEICLLSLIVSDLEDNKKFVKEILKIDKIDKIKIDFNKTNYSEYNNNPTLEFVNEIDKKSEYTLSEFKKIMTDKGYIENDIFKYLYIAFTPKDTKIIENIVIKYNGHLTVEDLSEGEKKLLLIKGALEFAEQEDSLFILDEPDAHVHINNKIQISNIFYPYRNNRQIIITTHSPTLTECVEDDNVYMLNSGKIESKKKQEIIEDLTGDFWNKHQQNTFLSSKKNVILLVEGKHDKEHILNAFNKLRNEYIDIEFDVFYMNSACNIPPMMLGLRTSEIQYNKLIIGVFDNDETGRIELSKTEAQYPNNQNKKRHILGYYGLTYPKHTEHKSKDFTVENFFDTKHLLSSFSEAFNVIENQIQGKSVESINEKLKDTTKAILFDKSKSFLIEDFKHFKLLFDQIRDIKSDFENLKVETKKADDDSNIKKEDKSKTPKKENGIKVFSNRRGTEAKGIYIENNNRFIVIEGSKISSNVVDSFKENELKQRNEILSINAEQSDDSFIVKKDIEFGSPSGAIKFCTGSNINGWKAWKTDEGKTLDEIVRK